MLKAAIHKALNLVGYELYRLPSFPNSKFVTPQYECIHYASGTKYLDGWLNVDTHKNGPSNYLRVNLTERHPFPDNSFRLGFCEDFLEHIDQADSLMFLVEVHRTLKPGGVLRLSFPSFESTLTEHYGRIDYGSFAAGKQSAYVHHRHRHFYSRNSLETLANHLGFRIEFAAFRESKHPELQGLETRPLQAESNIHAELTKPISY